MSSPTTSSPRELQERIRAERRGVPFLVYHTVEDGQRILSLESEVEHVTIGRGEGCQIRLQHDPEVSRLHAELWCLGGEWVACDDGLSRNGTFVNAERLVQRRRLLQGDVIRCGATLVTFHDPRVGLGSTHPADERPAPGLSDMQRRVLVELCRPLRDGGAYAVPASNQVIAEALHLSIGGVKGHLRTLFAKLEVETDLPHNRKRARLAERAVESGVVKLADFAHEPGTIT